ncbi:MAG TPA: TIM44-like domain-containing protein, partial [Pseudomonadota bacterium]|nr:TIM44-like domain-containing protein [Pseudomonadota bacterium]
MLKSTLSASRRRTVLVAVLLAFCAWVIGRQVEARPGGGQSYRSSTRSSSSSSGSSRSYSSGSRSSSSSSYGSSSSSSSSSSRSYSSGSSYSGSSSSSTTVYVPSSGYHSSSSGCNGFTWVVLILIVAVLLYLYLRGRKGSNGSEERATIDVDQGTAQAGIAALKERDPEFDPAAFVERSRTVVSKVNDAWLGGHMGPTRRLISDGVFTRFNTQLQLLKA